MRINEMEINIGKIKAIVDRQRNYFGLFNFIMIAYLFFDKVGWQWYYLLIIPFWFLWAYIDVTFIMPRELNYIHHKSPVMKELLRNGKTKSTNV